MNFMISMLLIYFILLEGKSQSTNLLSKTRKRRELKSRITYPWWVYLLRRHGSSISFTVRGYITTTFFLSKYNELDLISSLHDKNMIKVLYYGKNLFNKIYFIILLQPYLSFSNLLDYTNGVVNISGSFSVDSKNFVMFTYSETLGLSYNGNNMMILWN